MSRTRTDLGAWATPGRASSTSCGPSAWPRADIRFLCPLARPLGPLGQRGALRRSTWIVNPAERAACSTTKTAPRRRWTTTARSRPPTRAWSPMIMTSSATDRWSSSRRPATPRATRCCWCDWPRPGRSSCPATCGTWRRAASADGSRLQHDRTADPRLDGPDRGPCGLGRRPGHRPARARGLRVPAALPVGPRVAGRGKGRSGGRRPGRSRVADGQARVRACLFAVLRARRGPAGRHHAPDLRALGRGGRKELHEGGVPVERDLGVHRVGVARFPRCPDRFEARQCTLGIADPCLVRKEPRILDPRASLIAASRSRGRPGPDHRVHVKQLVPASAIRRLIATSPAFGTERMPIEPTDAGASTDPVGAAAWARAALGSHGATPTRSTARHTVYPPGV